jgi:hypothetical protein
MSVLLMSPLALKENGLTEKVDQPVKTFVYLFSPPFFQVREMREDQCLIWPVRPKCLCC